VFEILNRLTLPDAWQTEAIQAARAGSDVIVDAPTGAGKTFIVERLIESSAFPRQVIHTAPTRALANDKFAEWRAKGWRVGIATGDLTLHPEAPVIVGTLEAVHRRALEERPSLLVLDEYQWLADSARGNHYEGLILSLPHTVRLILLSGSVANPGDVAAWLRRLGRAVHVVSHRERPVPLEEIDGQALAKRVPTSIPSFWARCIAGALRDDLGPVLLFAPHRKDAEQIAQQLVRELPPCAPLTLSPEQSRLAGPALAKALTARIAWHHSGLTYSQRAGLVEPLAKHGQLRAVASTLGLASGINFSLRSVLITHAAYSQNGIPRALQPQEILQMAGRAGRRGLDEAGYFILTRHSPRLGSGRPMPLRRAPALPWPRLFATLAHATDPRAASLPLGHTFFHPEPLRLGCEDTWQDDPASLPCALATDTARARLARRTQRPFKGCRTCPHHPRCLTLSPQPSLLWQWTRIGLLDRALRPTARGRIATAFLGPEGLALAAALEDESYPLDDLLIDLANLFAADRFAGDEPRWAGRLAETCRAAYGNFSIEGWLDSGMPPQYGSGAAEVLRGVLNRTQRKSQLTGEHSGVGDIDRLLIEWRSLLRQIGSAEPFPGSRGTALQEKARSWLALAPEPAPPDLPPLTPAQTQPLSHRIRW
jgi:hypothetical protein